MRTLRPQPKATGRAGLPVSQLYGPFDSNRREGRRPFGDLPFAAPVTSVLKLNRFLDRQTSHAAPSFWHPCATP
jgi:hypothetical protein